MNNIQSLVIATHDVLPPDNPVSSEKDVPSSRKTCIRDDGDDHYHLKFMFVSSFLYFLAVGLSSISLIFLINLRIAGDASDPNSSSIFVQTTVVFLTNACSFSCLRYNSGIGDFVGRKPIIVFSAIVLIGTRLSYAFAHTPAHFFVTACISGATESFYVSTLAWVCDIIPSHSERSKYYGIFAGIAGLAGVVIGAPLGAALSITVSPRSPFLLSTLFSLSSAIVTILNPCVDTLALQAMTHSEYRSITSNRAIPRCFVEFFSSHFPISRTTFNICLESKQVLDWVTFTVAQWTWAVLVLILVQFLLKVYNWSEALSAFCLLTMGLSLAVVVPFLQNHFEPISLSFYSMGCQGVGYLLLSVSGTGVARFQFVGVPGLALVALGLSWLPCSQSIIMSGYDFGKQGVVSGLIGQMNDFAMLPAYIISLSFTFNSERGSGHVYWPGCAFGICTAVLVFAMCLHFFAHGKAVLVLKHRRHFKGGESVDVPGKNIEFTMVISADSKKTEMDDIDEDSRSVPLPPL